MNKFYDQEYLGNTVIGLFSDLHDLDKWSVYNGDEYNEEVDELRRIVDKIAQKAGIVSISKKKE